MPDIDTTEKLEEFRETSLNPATALKDIVNTPGLLFYFLMVGVGKSYFIDKLIDLFRTNPLVFPYDGIIVSAPTHRILKERRVLQDDAHSSGAVLLSGRPRAFCGEEYNRQWHEYERSGSYALGKEHICRNCSLEGQCPWPHQFSSLDAEKHKVVLLPQKYIEIDTHIISRIISKLEFKRPLVIMDEANFSTEVFRRRLRRGTLEVFHHVLELFMERNPTGVEVSKLLKYREDLRALLDITDESQLHRRRWYFPPLERTTAMQLQDIGMEYYGANFYYPGFDLNSFSKHHPGLRRISEYGHIEFSTTPCLEGEGKVLVLSGTASAQLLRYRLDTNVTEMYADYTFKNRSSHIYNLNIGSGCDHYHAQHLEQMTCFAAGYIQRSFKQGKSVALITKKRFVSPSIERINTLLARRGWGAFRVVKAMEWDASDPAQIPVLHYGGAIGENTYTDIDNVLCLIGYYMRKDQLNRLMNEVTQRRYEVNFSIAIEGSPLRRVPKADPAGGICPVSLKNIAVEILKQEEIGVVIQAMGRIRPLTLPGKEVVLCQCGESEHLTYDQEFRSLQEAREYFNIPDTREVEANKKVIAIQYAKNQGQSQRQTAAASTISISTIRRGWNVPGQLLPQIDTQEEAEGA